MAAMYVKLEAAQPADLLWRQRVAAYWSIGWPAMIAYLLPAAYAPLSALDQDRYKLFAVMFSCFIVVHALLIARLTKKRYRSFYIEVIRNSPEQSQTLNAHEGLAVFVNVIWPQAAFWLMVLLLATVSTENGKRSLNGLANLLQLFAIGPLSIQIALQAKYPSFRLQPYSFIERV